MPSSPAASSTDTSNGRATSRVVVVASPIATNGTVALGSGKLDVKFSAGESSRSKGGEWTHRVLPGW
jgi:hypothetical protein